MKLDTLDKDKILYFYILVIFLPIQNLRHIKLKLIMWPIDHLGSFLERDQRLISPGSTINLQHCRLSQQQKAVEVLSTIFC